jgi:hypothetical protein
MEIPFKGLLTTIVILGVLTWMIIAASANDRANTERLVEETSQEDRQLQAQVDMMNDMLFYKDETTGLCFASTGGYRSRTMASVDCTKLGNPIQFWSK